MSENLQKDLEKLVSESLPQATANQLHAFFEKHEQLQRDHEEMTKIRDKLEKENQDLSDRNINLKERLMLAGNLETRELAVYDREKAVTQREDRQEILLLQMQSEMIMKHHQEFMTMIGKVFAHPAVTVTRNVEGTQAMMDAHGYIQSQPFNQDITETVRQEKQP